MQKISFPGLGIYRGMEEENGMPKVGDSAKRLGVRFPPDPKPDAEPDASGKIQPPTLSDPQGMSCAPTIQDLPLHRRPPKWGGKGHPSLQVWSIAAEDLVPDLIALRDKPTHITIGPARPMTPDELRAALAATQTKWVLMEPQP